MKLLLHVALISAAYVASVQASDVGSRSPGQPGFYGQLDIGGIGRPQVVYGQPVFIERRNWYPAPVYLRVPPYQYGNWHRYCGRYNACARPVYFVRDDWYRNVYAPRYHRVHPHGRDYAYERYDRRDDRHYDRDNGRNNDRGYDRNYDRRDDDRRDYDRDHGRH
jgi:hypothetical protein